MKKRLLSIILTVFLVLSMVPYAAFADDSIVCPACGGTVEKHSFHLVGNYWDFFKCNTCGKWAYLSGITGLKLFSAGDQQILNSADANAILNFAFNDGHLIPAKQVPTGIGRKDLPGYADDKGSALVDKDGWPTATYTMLLDGYDSNVGFDAVHKHSDSNNGSWFDKSLGAYSVNDGVFTSYVAYDSSKSNWLCTTISFYYIAPVTGYYTLNPLSYYVSAFSRDSSGKYFNGTTYDNQFYSFKTYSKGITVPKDQLNRFFGGQGVNKTCSFGPYTKFFNKGDFIFFSFRVDPGQQVSGDYPYKSISIKFTAPTLTVQDLTPSQITNNNNITINNNTWNGNIYVDNSTNLTYIYPEYTTINENNETVTNISNNPIIYNNETKQYYTYDTVTNNYYYITYEQPATPTPSPSPEPSPTPDPGSDPTPTPAPGGGTIITPGGGGSGSGSGSDSGITGGDDEGLFGWLWDLLKDLVKAILKAIFKVLSGLLGFLIWLVERVGILLPFLPAPAIAALGAGVVLVFVIRIIRFIRG